MRSSAMFVTVESGKSMPAGLSSVFQNLESADSCGPGYGPRCCRLFLHAKQHAEDDGHRSPNVTPDLVLIRIGRNVVRMRQIVPFPERVGGQRQSPQPEQNAPRRLPMIGISSESQYGWSGPCGERDNHSDEP